MGWTNVISSPTWSSWPSASPSSCKTEVAPAKGDSDSASFNSFPSSDEAPAIAILYKRP